MAEQTPPNDQNNQNQNNNQNQAPDEKQKEIDRLLEENGTLRKAQKDTESTLGTLKQELDGLKKSGMKGDQKWQELAQTYESENSELKKQVSTKESAFIGYLSNARVKEEALKLGLRPEAVGDIDSLDFDEVQVAIEGSRYNVKGAEVAAQNLKKLRPHWFKDEKAPNFNPGANGGGAPTQSETLAQAKEKYETALKNRFKDPEGFQKAYKDYQAAIFESRKAK